MNTEPKKIAIFKVLLEYICSMKDNMITAIAATMTKVMYNRVSLKKTCSSKNVLKYIIMYMTTPDVMIIAKNLRYLMQPSVH
tara:strand:+ start:4349 stop:4594 length:246 start_codon:yes stop_codon:yes gene_type:complete